MVIVGLSFGHHDAAACLVRDGRVVSAAVEAWFDGTAHSGAFPVQALNACLGIADITIDDVDRVAFYEKPFLTFERILMSHLRAFPTSHRAFLKELPPWLEHRLVLPIILRKEHGFDGKVHFIPHAIAHAASAFLPSPFEHAAILLAYGAGEWDTASLGRGAGNRITLTATQHYPHSIGLFYTAIASYLGFRPLQGEAHVEALSLTGRPTRVPALMEVARVGEDGAVEVNPSYLPLFEGETLFSPRLEALLGPARSPGEPLEQRHRDVAASAQVLLEKALLGAARRLHEDTGEDALCIAGGVANNTRALRRMLEDTPFSQVYLPPDPGDAGAAMGAALYLAHRLDAARPRNRIDRADLGPESPRSRVEIAVKNSGLPFESLDDATRAETIARRLARGEVIGWFSGRMTFSPRDLGARSILVSPRTPDAESRLARATGGEPMPPADVYVLDAWVSEVFDTTHRLPFKHLEAPFKAPWHDQVRAPAGLRATARILPVTREGNPRLHDLLEAHHALSGVPFLLGGDLAHVGAPRVLDPSGALTLLRQSPLDALVLEDWLVTPPATAPRTSAS